MVSGGMNLPGESKVLAGRTIRTKHKDEACPRRLDNEVGSGRDRNEM